MMTITTLLKAEIDRSDPLLCSFLAYDYNGGLLYGTIAGGPNKHGRIFSFDPYPPKGILKQLKIEHEFEMGTGWDPSPNGLLYAIDVTDNIGKLFGVTSQGGINGLGVIFSFDPIHGTYSDVYDFSAGDNISNPSECNLIQEPNLIYGTAKAANGDGVIFRFDIKTMPHFINLYHTSNFSPEGGLVWDGVDANFYGTSSSAGANHKGFIYSFSRSSSQGLNPKINFQSVYPFNDYDPNGLLYVLTDAGGMLFGVTGRGGAGNYGTVYSFDPAGRIFNTIAEFNGKNGLGPSCILVVAH